MNSPLKQEVASAAPAPRPNAARPDGGTTTGMGGSGSLAMPVPGGVLPGGGTIDGYVLRQNLTSNPVLPGVDASSGRPMSNQAFPSAGAGDKG